MNRTPRLVSRYAPFTERIDPMFDKLAVPPDCPTAARTSYQAPPIPSSDCVRSIKRVTTSCDHPRPCDTSRWGLLNLRMPHCPPQWDLMTNSRSLSHLYID